MDQQEQEEDKKTKLVEKAAASVPSSSSSSSSSTLRSLSNELAELHIDDDEASARAPPPLPKELIDFGSPVLDHLMRFLDNKSLKMCREVCKSWEKAARMALKKRCDRVDDNNSLPFAQLVCGCPKVCNAVNIQMNYY
jgi:hypothetical protein